MPHHVSTPSFGFVAPVAWVWAVVLALLNCQPLSAAQAKSVFPPVNIVLVHGIYDTGTIFKPLAKELDRLGYRCLAPSLTPNDCSSGVRALSLQLSHAIDTHFGKRAPVILVSFSMGGLVTRDYVQNLAAPGRVKAVFLISPPNHGTLWALFARGRARELATNSGFIQDLNRQNVRAWRHILVRTYWTPLDLMIFPSTSSLWSVGDSKTILCALHPWMVSNPRLAEDLTTQVSAVISRVSTRKPTDKRFY